jgi:hypothetical protein
MSKVILANLSDVALCALEMGQEQATEKLA